MEEWRQIPGFPAYDVSDLGNVRSRKPKGGFGRVPAQPRLMKPTIGPHGYPIVGIRGPDGRRVYWLVHRLVLFVFVGPSPAGWQCAHEDGVRSNCKLSNLSWKTCAANNADKARHGTANRGERHSCAVLTENDVYAIRELCPPNMTQQFADAFRVTRHSIANVLSRKTWSHI